MKTHTVPTSKWCQSETKHLTTPNHSSQRTWRHLSGPKPINVTLAICDDKRTGQTNTCSTRWHQNVSLWKLVSPTQTKTSDHAIKHDDSWTRIHLRNKSLMDPNQTSINMQSKYHRCANTEGSSHCKLTIWQSEIYLSNQSLMDLKQSRTYIRNQNLIDPSKNSLKEEPSAPQSLSIFDSNKQSTKCTTGDGQL
jgi:hypothetical protein